MTRPKKLPHHMLEKWESAIYGLKQIEGIARQMQQALANGDERQAFIYAGDIRSLALDAKDELHQARTGDYQHDSATRIVC